MSFIPYFSALLFFMWTWVLVSALPLLPLVVILVDHVEVIVVRWP